MGQKQGHERTYGHRYGVESVRNVLKAANEVGVETLTLYTFSEENWMRPKEEVETLMQLLVSAVHNELKSWSFGQYPFGDIGGYQ